MKKHLLPMNLQFFAEDTGATESEVAEPAGAETVDTSAEQTGVEGQEVAEPVDTTQVQSAEENAQYAAARRKAEAEQKMTDSRFARMFGGHTNPITGRPIQTAQDYLDAIEAQEQMNRMEQLKQSGVDPKLLNDAIMNSPVMRQAQQYINDQNMQTANAQIEKDLKVISEIDPSIKTIADLAMQDNFDEIMALVKNHNLSVDKAYKLANMDRISEKRQAAAQQAAINQAKGMQHMTSTNGGSQKDGLKEIPADKLANWKAMFPEASMKELKEKYNRVNR